VSRYLDVTRDLARIYDTVVDERASMAIQPWKQAECTAFLELLRHEDRRSLLEIGAGTGVHGRFFADAGLDVVCTDLSAAMVEHCRSIGLVAHQQDFLHLDLGRTFEAVFAMNCLLHVPREDFPAALAAIRSTLEPGGVFFLGQYCGVVRDGVWDGDSYDPPRYFSWLTDDELLAFARDKFRVESFHPVDVGQPDGEGHFQALVLRA